MILTRPPVTGTACEEANIRALRLRGLVYRSYTVVTTAEQCDLSGIWVPSGRSSLACPRPQDGKQETSIYAFSTDPSVHLERVPEFFGIVAHSIDGDEAKRLLGDPTSEIPDRDLTTRN